MFHIILYNPEIPPNTGNIARTCAVTGVHLHLIKPLGFSIDQKSVKRAGLDYWDQLELTIHENFDAFLEHLDGGNMWFASTKGGHLYSDVQYQDNDFIVFGQESKGLPPAFYERYADQLIRIPMKPVEGARSLNLSNAAAVLIYEALRQTGFDHLI